MSTTYCSFEESFERQNLLLIESWKDHAINIFSNAADNIQFLIKGSPVKYEGFLASEIEATNIEIRNLKGETLK